MRAGSRFDNGSPPLQSIYIYLTDECNQMCPHCWISPVAVGRSRVSRPDIEQYTRFIDAALPLGLDYVKLTGGEPLLRKETFPIIEHAARCGAYAGLETNAMLVGEKEAEFLKKQRVHVSVSLDGSCPEVHDRRRGLKGAFQRTVRALKLLAQSGVPLTVTTALSRSNYGELEKILELLCDIKGSGRLDLKINPIVPMGRASFMKKSGETLQPHELLDLVESVRNEYLPRSRARGVGIVLQLELAFFPIDSILRREGTAGAGHCGFLNLISLLADGSITFCGIGYTRRDLVMGNIRGEYDLPGLWKSHPQMLAVRRRVLENLDGVCGSCLFHPVCLGGCRAAAVAVEGSIAGSPPWCQALYNAGLFPPSRLNDEAATEYARIAPRLKADYEDHSGPAETVQA